jgi:Fe(3+) dicitrate transport protein
MTMDKTLIAQHVAKVLLLAAITATTAPGHGLSADGDKEAKKSSYDEKLQIIGHDKQLRTEAGSATLIPERVLENFEYDDINRVLAIVPGVNIREEDGYGLRPNIGFRGSTPERSKKISLMEDGILIAPAPYSAPAAYYFPLVSRMTAIEVFKGPAAIKYGPNTVSGALNMITRQVPDDFEGGVDLALGSDGYTKQHVFAGNTIGDLGFVFDILHAQADGFKQLDGGGDTGFDKNDVMAKFRYNLDGEDYSQLVELKLAYGDEISNETYLGLSDDDFAATPFRRYAASQQGLMDWVHKQYQLTHHIDYGDLDVLTRVYRNDFERSWRKVNGFVAQGNPATDRSLAEILAAPEQGINAIYYQVLSGEQDSQSSYENLVLGTNAREYYSQGVQSDLQWQFDISGLDNVFEAGVRYHQDQISRNHTEDTMKMTAGKLTDAGFATKATTVNRESSDVWSVYAQNTLNWHKFSVTTGVRGEFIDAEYRNLKAGLQNDWLQKSSHIWLPSVSAFYQMSDSLGFLFGVHEGHVPTSPQQHPNVQAEKSLNYELGLRHANDGTSVDLIGFFNDYSNLKESCTFSASSNCANTVDQEYDGGEVDIYGLEASFAHTFDIGSGIEVPVNLVYTHTQSEFKQELASDFPLWGHIRPGDEVPYLPDNQLTLTTGLVGQNWQVSLLARYVGEMSEAAGEGVALSGVATKAYTVVDLSASYDFADRGSVYVKVDNVFDSVEAVSHRPYGARPSKPQQLVAGYKYRF